MKRKVLKFKKLTGCSGMEFDISLTHLRSPINYATLCGIGEEEFDGEETIIAELTCPDCLDMVDIVKEYLAPIKKRTDENT